jgi:hypothetical protein
MEAFQQLDPELNNKQQATLTELVVVPSSSVDISGEERCPPT